MTLLITLFAAIITTIIWYVKLPDDSLRLGTLLFIYWGASLMWTVDAVFEYAELGEELFMPEASALLNDAFLGLSAVAFGLLIWLVILLVKDPKGVIKKALFRRD